MNQRGNRVDENPNVNGARIRVLERPCPASYADTFLSSIGRIIASGMEFPIKLGTGEMNDVWRVPDSCGQRFKKSDFSLGARMRVNRKIREQNVAQVWPNFSRRGGKLTSTITLLGSLSCLTSCRETGIRGDQSAGRNQLKSTE